jgi:hypothetical protein
LRTALEVVFAVALVVISAPFAFSMWTRRGEKRPDRPGERTVAIFRGCEKYASDEAALARAVAEALRKRGATVDAPEADEGGWRMSATLGDDRAHVVVARTEEEDAVTWILRVVDPSGGPGPSALIPLVDLALRDLDVEHVEWQRR